MAKKTSINEYKNRLDSPIGAVRISPKTGKPIRAKKNTTGSRKKKK